MQPRLRRVPTRCSVDQHDLTYKVCVHSLRQARDDVRALRTAAALARAGFAVSVVDIEHDRSRPRTEDLREMPGSVTKRPSGLEGPIPIRHIFFPSKFEKYYDPTNYVMWLLFKCWRVLSALLPVLMTAADVYHASDITALPACQLAAWLRRKRLVFEAYELPLVQTWITRSRLVHAASARALRSLVRHCHAIITVSPPIAGEFHRRYGGAMPVVVRNIPVFQMPTVSDRLRQYLGLSPDTRIALYQGGIMVDRGLEALVHAAKFLSPGSVIVMMGGGEGRTELMGLVDKERVSDRVKIIPAVPYAELLEWTASANIGLVVFRPLSLSVQWCLPNKLFEYLMAGLPVLTSPLEAVVEVINRYDVGRVLASLAPEALALAIGQMLADRAGLRRMRANALAAAERELCWEMEQEKLIGLYEDILRAHVQQPNRPQVRACT